MVAVLLLLKMGPCDIGFIVLLVSIERRRVLLLLLFQSKKKLMGGVLDSVVYGRMDGYDWWFVNYAIPRPLLLDHDRQCIVFVVVVVVGSGVASVVWERPVDLVNPRKSSGSVMDSKVIALVERHGRVRQGQP